ncbi:MAG: MarR family transcriptional regulator [Bacteroidia bacterium]|nr:MarR family transcriptional regulator [Bacteroidia bacterium]
MEREIRIPGPCVNFKVAVLFRLMAERYQKAYTGLGLTNEQVRMLLNLKGAGSINQRGLAERLELEKSTFSRTLKGMIKKGFISAKGNPEDGRQFILSLTQKGENKVGKIYPAWKTIHEETHALFGQASINELDRMLRILKQPDLL